jgi:hypothetical protein
LKHQRVIGKKIRYNNNTNKGIISGEKMNGMFESIKKAVEESYRPRYDSLLTKARIASTSRASNVSINIAELFWASGDYDKAIEILNNVINREASNGNS